MLSINFDSVAFLIVIWPSIFAYGIYVVLICIYLHLILRRKSPQRWVLVSIILLFLLSTAKLSMDLAFALSAFETGFFLAILRQRASFFLAGLAIHITQSVVADALLIYRCFIVWNSSKLVIAPPTAMVIASAVTGYASKDTGATFLFLTLATNILVTCLLAGRIWWINRRLRIFLGPAVGSQYRVVINLIVESGLLYTLSLAFLMASYKSPWAKWMMYDLTTQIAGIAPMLLSVRVGGGAGSFERNQGTDSSSTNVQLTTVAPFESLSIRATPSNTTPDA